MIFLKKENRKSLTLEKFSLRIRFFLSFPVNILNNLVKIQLMMYKKSKQYCCVFFVLIKRDINTIHCQFMKILHWRRKKIDKIKFTWRNERFKMNFFYIIHGLINLIQTVKTTQNEIKFRWNLKGRQQKYKLKKGEFFYVRNLMCLNFSCLSHFQLNFCQIFVSSFLLFRESRKMAHKTSGKRNTHYVWKRNDTLKMILWGNFF